MYDENLAETFLGIVMTRLQLGQDALFRVPRLRCFVWLVLASLWSCISTDDPRNSPDSEKASIRLKVGEYRICDVRFNGM